MSFQKKADGAGKKSFGSETESRLVFYYGYFSNEGEVEGGETDSSRGQE